MLSVVLAGILVVVLSITAYNILSGRNFLLDARDRMRMKSRSIEDWHAYWEANPTRSDIVICLTTIPSRLGEIEGTLKSLLFQKTAPSRIRLHLPYRSRREGTEYSVPEKLARLAAIEIVRCEDYGPATKLIPALKGLAPDTKLLVVDDDKLYPDTMVAHFDRAAAEYPDAALASSGWVVPSDLTDRPVTTWRNFLGQPPSRLKATRLSKPADVDIVQGHSGYLMRPRFFDPDRLIADYEGAPQEAFYVDDVWISAYCNAPKKVIPARRFCFVSYGLRDLYDRTALERINSGAGDPESNYNTVMIRYLRDRWMLSSQGQG
jgi:hypothetical protein